MDLKPKFSLWLFTLFIGVVFASETSDAEIVKNLDFFRNMEIVELEVMDAEFEAHLGTDLDAHLNNSSENIRIEGPINAPNIKPTSGPHTKELK